MSEDQRPVSTADFRAGLAEQKTELLSAMAGQKTELLSAMADQRTELLSAMAEQKTELLSVMADQKTELLSAMADQKTELEGFMRQIETNILTAFHGYARGVATHLHTLDVGDQDIRLRLGVLEERVLALETRRPS